MVGRGKMNGRDGNSRENGGVKGRISGLDPTL